MPLRLLKTPPTAPAAPDEGLSSDGLFPLEYLPPNHPDTLLTMEDAVFFIQFQPFLAVFTIGWTILLLLVQSIIQKAAHQSLFNVQPLFL